MKRPVVDLLAELPEIYALLPAVLTTRTPGSEADHQARRTAPGAPMRTEVLVLLDRRFRAGDFDALEMADADIAAGADRQGLLPSLWTWCRLMEAELLDDGAQVTSLPEKATMVSVCAWLARYDPWAQTRPWAAVWEADIRRRHAAASHLVRHTSPQPAHVCSQCAGQAAELVNDGDLWACPECGHADPGPRRQIDAYRRRPSMPTDMICALMGCTETWLRQQKARGRLRPDTAKGDRPLWWWPWDVFRLQNPAVVAEWDRARAQPDGVLS